LRFRSNLSELNQYYERNIPDAQSWLEVTEGALNNMEKLLENIYTKCVDGSTDVKTQEDRAAILKDLQSLRNQIYAEGNTDYAGRTVFTGFKTTSQLTFLKEDQDIKYEITEPLSYENIEENKKQYEMKLSKIENRKKEMESNINLVEKSCKKVVNKESKEKCKSLQENKKMANESYDNLSKTYEEFIENHSKWLEANKTVAMN